VLCQFSLSETIHIKLPQPQCMCRLKPQIGTLCSLDMLTMCPVSRYSQNDARYIIRSEAYFRTGHSPTPCALCKIQVFHLYFSAECDFWFQQNAQVSDINII